MEKLRFMSNNIWWCENNTPNWAEKGEDCSAEHRSKGFARVYDETAPDVIGIQEAGGSLPSKVMTALLNQSKIPYSLLWGKDTPIIYRADKFEVIDTSYDIYPEELSGYEGSFNNLSTKSYCVAVFRTKEEGKLFIFATTHLWYMREDQQAGSDAARTYQLGILMDKIEQFKARYKCPVFMVGDFNTYYNSEAVQSALKRGYISAYHLATDYRDETCGYHHCAGDRYEGFDNKKTVNESIDQFMVKSAPEGSVKRFDRFYPEYYYPLSDHFPIIVDVEL